MAANGDSVAAAKKPPVPTAVLVWLILSQFGYLASLVPWLVMSGLAVMAFDSPGSTENWQPWLFVGLVWSYPLVPLACSIVAWVLYGRGRGRAAALVTSVPLVLIAAAVSLMVMVG